MTAEARLQQALQGALDELMSAVGLPADAEDPYAARQRVDEVLIDRDHVPSSAWRAACYGMDILMIGLGVLEDGPPLTPPKLFAVKAPKLPSGAVHVGRPPGDA